MESHKERSLASSASRKPGLILVVGEEIWARSQPVSARRAGKCELFVSWVLVIITTLSFSNIALG